MDSDDLEAALREAVQHHVLVSSDLAGDAYTFRHALLREAVYADLLPGERVRLHTAYAKLAGTKDSTHAEALAYHSLNSNDLPTALGASVQAASNARSAGALAAELRHLEQALELWDAVDDPEEHTGLDELTLHRKAGYAAIAAGHPERALGFCKAALALADQQDDPVLAADVRRQLREQADRSRERLGVERLDLYYAHGPDLNGVPLEDTVAAFGKLVADGTVCQLGISNHWAWQLERWRTLATETRMARADVLQYHHTYLRMRTDVAIPRLAPDGQIGAADGSILSYGRAESALSLVWYSPLLNGAYMRPDKPLDVAYEHAGTTAKLAVLDEIVKETGATVNQVVLAWMLGGELPVIPLVGFSTVAQLEEALAAVDLELTGEQRARMDAVNG